VVGGGLGLGGVALPPNPQPPNPQSPIPNPHPLNYRIIYKITIFT